MAGVTGTLKHAISNLDATEQSQASQAAAILTVIAPQTDPRDPLLYEAVQKLVPLLSAADVSLQRNACAALASVIYVGFQCFQTAISQNAVSATVSLLKTAKTDPGLRMNSLVLAGALIEGGPSGPEEFYRAEGLVALMPHLRRENDAKLLEVAIDDVCKLATEPSARQPLVDAGVLPMLGELLGVEGEPEVLVRTLMGLGMLLGSNSERLRQLAEVPEAVQNLLAIMRSSTDPDSKAIASEIFTGLGKDEEAKKLVAAALQK